MKKITLVLKGIGGMLIMLSLPILAGIMAKAIYRCIMFGWHLF